MRKRILFTSYTADWTGPTNSLLLLLKYLRQSYNLAVLLPGQGLFSRQLAQEKIRFFNVPALDKWSIPEIIRLLHDEDFDLIYGNTTHGSSRNALIAAKLVGFPFICHVREMGWGKSWRQLGYLRLANAVVAVSHACATSIGRFVPENRLYIIHNGIDMTSMGQTSDPDCSSLLASPPHQSQDRTTIISMAHICPRKGQALAVEAMEEVVKKAPDTRLLLLGSLDRAPAYAKSVQALIQEKKLRHHVSLMGFRANPIEILQTAAFFLHTANKDPHPRAVIEAMAMGLPVVAFAADGIAETVVDGQTGYLVPVGDAKALAEAIHKLITNPSLRKEMGSNGRRRVEKLFTAELTAAKVARVIESVLSHAS